MRTIRSGKPLSPSWGMVVACVLAIAAGCGKMDEAAPIDAASTEEQSVLVDASPATVEKVEITLDAVGTLEAAEDVWLTTEAAGMVRKLLFEEGATVEKGTPLVLFDDDMARLEKIQAEKQLERLTAGLTRRSAEVRRAEAQAENTRSNYERKEALLDQGATTRATYLDAKTEYDSALAALDEAKAALEETRKSITEAEAGLKIAEEHIAQLRVLAPFDGILGERRVGPGDYVDLGQEIVRLVAVDPLKVRFDLPERFRNRVSMDQAVTLSVEAWPGESFRGEVVYIAPSLDPATRTIRLKAVLDNGKAKLQPGFFSHVRLIVEVNPEAVLIPEQAVIPRGEDFFIYKIEEEKAKLTRVELGQRLAGSVEVRSGVVPGDAIITAGHHRVADGSPVTVRETNGPDDGDSAAAERSAAQ